MAFVGDDFTGSTDALEQLERGGVPAVLLTTLPTSAMMSQFAAVGAIGVATLCRTRSNTEMDATLPGVFASLAALNAQFVHYKVCSTFDSSPAIGNIGRAIDIATREFQNRLTPLVVGAPSLGRYCVFGNLFARSGLDSPVVRLDRHPTMSRHPVTPMGEADLRRHLSEQTDRPIELIDVLTLDGEPTALFNRLAACADGAVVLFDVLTNRHLATIGAALVELQRREDKPLFVVGSSAIESALTNRWRTLGQIRPREMPPPGAVDRLLVVSGSCSPVTDRQIGWAIDHGFAEIALDAASLSSLATAPAEITAIADRIKNEHDQGRSVVVHTCRGIADPLFASQNPKARSSLGAVLGMLVREVLRGKCVRRVAVAGGDTAGALAAALNIDSLEMVAPHVPGAPVCRARSSAKEVDDVEFIFKGGQVGHDDYFEAVLRGT